MDLGLFIKYLDKPTLKFLKAAFSNLKRRIRFFITTLYLLLVKRMILSLALNVFLFGFALKIMKKCMKLLSYIHTLYTFFLYKNRVISTNKSVISAGGLFLCTVFAIHGL